MNFIRLLVSRKKTITLTSDLITALYAMFPDYVFTVRDIHRSPLEIAVWAAWVAKGKEQQVSGTLGISETGELVVLNETEAFTQAFLQNICDKINGE